MMLALLLSAIAAAASPPPTGGPPCPLQRDEQGARGNLICISEIGANWSFAFAWTEAAAAVPALDRELRSRARASRAEVEGLVPYAAEHPDGRFFHEEIYSLDADLPELLALTSVVSDYSGGAHGWSGTGSLIWDRAAGREIGLMDLFADRPAARAEIERLFCPTLLDVTRRAFAQHGGRFDGPCRGLPEEMALIVGASGRIETLRVTESELHGYAGGQYDLYLPVTAELIAAMHARYLPAFAASSAVPLGCNSNLPDTACEARQRQ
jgi:hypothetical protein